MDVFIPQQGPLFETFKSLTTKTLLNILYIHIIIIIFGDSIGIIIIYHSQKLPIHNLYIITNEISQSQYRHLRC